MTRPRLCATLMMQLHLVEKEASTLAALTEGLAPLDHATAAALVRRWLAIPVDCKPRCNYRCRFDRGTFTAGASTICACNASGFVAWLTMYLGERFYPELLKTQPALAKAFRSQFLEVVAGDYAFFTEKTGPMLGRIFQNALARGLLELVDRVLGENCRRGIQ